MTESTNDDKNSETKHRDAKMPQTQNHHKGTIETTEKRWELIPRAGKTITERYKQRLQNKKKITCTTTTKRWT